MKVLWILSLGLLAIVASVAQAQTTCGARVRKDWDAMTATEKTTYKNAIAAAMDSGAYIKFVEMHTEMKSEMEAHNQCMFVYWHRLLLVVFENMLRGQGAAYACVTVPYFNWIVAAARVTAGTCNSFGSCMAITRELGGWKGTQRTLAINGINNSGRCVAVSPLDHFCQLTSITGTACVKCIPRSDWSAARVPTAAGYASVRNQVLGGKTIGQMSPLVEKGCHNNVHANLGSTMGTFASPADPLFWSHHAMVDALHSIFHKCRVGTAILTTAQKTASAGWTSCARRDTGTFNPTDAITMRTGEKGVNPIPGRTDPKIGKYFTGVPTQFVGLMDTRDLGTSSYTYAFSGQLATLYSQCDAAPTTRKLEEMMESTETNGTSKCSVTQDEESGSNGNYLNIIALDNTGKQIDADTPTEAYITDEDEKRVIDWYDQTMEAMGRDSHENMADLERQACMFEHVCLGGTKDYSPEFKALWKVKEPRCKTIVDAIVNGSESIIYESWRENMEAQFGCPDPTDSTNSTSYSGSWGSSGDGTVAYSVMVGSQESVEDSNDTINYPEPAFDTAW
ncbi:hypothetical protein PHYSODRAFT_262769 [Phytophthora sojae]|uniref:Tyrosinase copper-binding domain-containing protein n=1 Tax=Phytophthora sojae (strain P6497) TaxID=1094619 RepID=G5AB89_PHYSP|nr:hypothetical protein PHYSODRAFT_262769 [Phytophthora sojae]EGZ07234.1 hypothetical protein PHYSODRAFT_262769 [Phytophthora sojae]|eukprot:XP_009536800.1 hypothetical protein PHYSODRAFT_262769 [Phytophthora sojae]